MFLGINMFLALLRTQFNPRYAGSDWPMCHCAMAHTWAPTGTSKWAPDYTHLYNIKPTNISINDLFDRNRSSKGH